MPNVPSYRRLLSFAYLILIAVLLYGCSHNKTLLDTNKLKTSQPVAHEDISLNDNDLSERTLVILRTFDIKEEVKENRQKVIDGLAPWLDISPRPGMLFAFAELCYKEGLTQEKQGNSRQAMKLYTQCLTYSYKYLFCDQYDAMRNFYDQGFRDMCILYNGSSTQIMRLIQHGSKKEGTTSEKAMPFVNGVHFPVGDSQVYNIAMHTQAPNWTDKDISEIQFVADYNISKLNNVYRQYGIGVPLMILRNMSPNDPSAKYSPKHQYFPATAIIRPNLDALNSTANGINLGSEQSNHLVIELYDSVNQSSVTINNHTATLESDYTTALVASMNDLYSQNVGMKALMDPDALQKIDENEVRALKGFYMPQPYDPTKTPVIFIHGLASSPITWLDMFNTLRTVPLVRQNYQLWFYMYPNGQPFWVSAAQFRADLAELRHTLDPQGQAVVSKNIVLVGHSMGGLVSRLQTINSDENLWHVASNRSIDQLNASSETKAQLHKWFHFRYDPTISKVVFLGVPQRGSALSNFSTRGLSGALTQTAQEVDVVMDDLSKGRNPEATPDSFLKKYTNSVDSLSDKSPMFPAIEKCERCPTTKFYSIIGQAEKMIKKTDSVVAYESSHVDFVEKETIVTALHTELTHCQAAILQVGFVLMEDMLKDKMKGMQMGGTDKFRSSQDMTQLHQGTPQNMSVPSQMSPTQQPVSYQNNMPTAPQVPTSQPQVPYQNNMPTVPQVPTSQPQVPYQNNMPTESQAPSGTLQVPYTSPELSSN